MLTPSVVGIEHAFRQVRQASGEKDRLTAGGGALVTKPRASAIATTTAIPVSRRFEGGEDEALHARQGGYTRCQVPGHGYQVCITAVVGHLIEQF